MPEMLRLKVAFNPAMALPISVTVTMPMTMPRVVRPARILLARRRPGNHHRSELGEVHALAGGFIAARRRQGSPHPLR